MAEQLQLLDRGEPDFHLDPHTREIGKRGLAEARRVLAEVVQAAAERADEAQGAHGGHGGHGGAQAA